MASGAVALGPLFGGFTTLRKISVPKIGYLALFRNFSVIDGFGLSWIGPLRKNTR